MLCPATTFCYFQEQLVEDGWFACLQCGAMFPSQVRDSSCITSWFTQISLDDEYVVVDVGQSKQVEDPKETQHEGYKYMYLSIKGKLQTEAFHR